MSCEAIEVMVLELSCKALSSLLPLDEGKLVKDLNDNFMVKRDLEMISGGLSLRYGKPFF